jgi:ribonuclease HI
VPWIEAMLRGQKVLARANDEGEFVAEGGRVEIRYKPNDGRAYRAAKGNLSRAEGARTFPDDHCTNAEAAPSAYQKEKEKKAASKARFDRENAEGAPTARKPHEWVAYTDGACSGNPGPAGAGFVVIAPDGKIHEGYEYLGEATNNVAELTAILRGLEGVPDVGAAVRVLTDSGYSIGVLTKGWKAKTNQELIARVKQELQRRPNAYLSYVPGHAGVPMNERADQLAREAVTSRRTKALS